ncbi:DUF429 domain-containing protein [Roseisolibacter agri]|uniref:DUF429 domain-containing protein n=1 Tax=Roseisolibacter agri TaxID=2014610 RepID=A0AA37Q735_9BACT|nr:DUF429 domain-containing protein [Roseisolibacter agri]GLC27769.1 hypothetical protein rosag_42820 [Roseisolibacter agri]
MTVVSLDLAYRSYEDNGLVVLRGSRDTITVTIERLRRRSVPTPATLAREVQAVAQAHEATYLLIDGPQGWKDPASGLLHARHCERALATPAKTGELGHCLPATWLGYVAFSIDVFDWLTATGWRLLGDEFPLASSGGPTVAETFPTAAWRTLRIAPLPGKSRSTAGDVRAWYGALEERYSLIVDSEPTHDELQAIVAGMAGLALERGTDTEVARFGTAPFRRDGSWREGYIVCPRADRDDSRALSQPRPTSGGSVKRRRSEPAGRSSAARTTQPGYVNRNQQEVLSATGRPGSDHNALTYLLRCQRCGNEYGANGTDIWQRRCPQCQGGAPGNPL